MKGYWLIDLEILIGRVFEYVNFFLESSTLVSKRFIFLQNLISAIGNLNNEVKLSLVSEFEINLGGELGFENGEKFVKFLVWGVDELKILLIGKN